MGKTILVSAGHGAGDPGAEGFGHREADLALELRDMVAPLLARRGHTVMRDGEERENLSRFEAIARARRCDLALEIHFNGTDPAATGVECFGEESSRTLCKRLSRAVANVLGLKLRGGRGGYKHHTETRHGLKGLGFCKAGGVLLEVCWMNEHDLTLYLPRKAAIAGVIADVLDAAAAGPLLDDDATAPSPTSTPARPRKRVAPGSSTRSRGAPQRRPTR